MQEKMMLLKKDGYNAQIKYTEDKIPNFTNLATNTSLNGKINEVKNEIPTITNLVANASLSAKINQFKNKIPIITNLATNAPLTAVEKKIPDHSKYITAPEFKKLRAESFTA